VGEAVVLLAGPGTGLDVVYACDIVAPFAFCGLNVMLVSWLKGERLRRKLPSY
jgi:hypothetical protein